MNMVYLYQSKDWKLPNVQTGSLILINSLKKITANKIILTAYLGCCAVIHWANDIIVSSKALCW
jgi:predicted alpha/beta hydrolase family esterase